MRNPKLLTYLRQGCMIIFPSGYLLEGVPDSDLICTGIIDIQDDDKTVLGYRTLSEEGLLEALDNQEEYCEGQMIEKEMKRQEAKQELRGS